jgi:hypothetical protein
MRVCRGALSGSLRRKALCGVALAGVANCASAVLRRHKLAALPRANFLLRFRRGRESLPKLAMKEMDNRIGPNQRAEGGLRTKFFHHRKMNKPETVQKVCPDPDSIGW